MHGKRLGWGFDSMEKLCRCKWIFHKNRKKDCTLGQNMLPCCRYIAGEMEWVKSQRYQAAVDGQKAADSHWHKLRRLFAQGVRSRNTDCDGRALGSWGSRGFCDTGQALSCVFVCFGSPTSGSCFYFFGKEADP